MNNWSILCAQQLQLLPCFEGLVELNPRLRQIRIDQFPQGTTNSELQGRAVIRLPFRWSVSNIELLKGWFGQPKAQDLLLQIVTGYRAEMRWSGDYQAYWTESSWNALLQIKAHIDECLSL